MDVELMFGAPARVLWKAVRLPIVFTLLLVEPVINAICGFVILGSLFAAVAFEFSVVSARFPLLLVLALCVSAAVLAVVYHSVVALLVRD